MSEGRLRWIVLLVLGAVLALALRHMASPKTAEADRPAHGGGEEVVLTIPVEIVEAGQAPRRLEVKIPTAVEIPAPLR